MQKTVKFLLKEPINFSYSVVIKLDAKNHFYCHLPEDVVELCKKYKISNGLDYNYNRGRQENPKLGYLRAQNFDSLERKILEINKEIVSVKKIGEEFMIEYAFDLRVMFALDDKEIVPNGRYGTWYHTEFGEYNGTYPSEGVGILFFAQIIKRITYQYQNGDTYHEDKYVLSPIFDNDDMNFIAETCGVKKLSSGGFVGSHRPQFMKCTEKSAAFFANLFKSVFKQAMIINEFAKDHDSFTELIENNSNLLGFNNKLENHKDE